MSSCPTIPATTTIAASRPEAARSGATGRRLAGLAVALGALAILIIAANLEPSPTGIGTHRHMMGLPPCTWIVTMDMPCPTCGMTTAYAHAANGDILAALHAQPLGGVLAIGTAMAFLLGTHVAVTGSRTASMLTRLWRPWSGWGIATAVVLAWGYKILTYKGVIP